MENKIIISINKQIIGIIIFLIITLAFYGCLTTEQKALNKQIYEQLNRTSINTLTGEPLEGETVLKQYMANYSTFYINSFANEYDINEINMNKSNESRFAKFSVKEAAKILLTLAHNEFPDIPLEDLDVRSIKYNTHTFLTTYPGIGNPYFNIQITTPYTSPGKTTSTRNLSVSATFPFIGTVVRVKR